MNTDPLLNEIVSDQDFITSFFKHPSEYMHFLMDCKEIAIATDKAPACIATLTKQDRHYVYSVEKDGYLISDNIKPFRANENNVRKFNEGCHQCAQVLSLYIRTQDQKQLPEINPFGDLTWNEDSPEEPIESPQGNPIPKGKYFPELRNARVVKKIDAGTHELVLLTDVDAIGIIKYLHMLTATNKSTNDISFLVSAELGTKHREGFPMCFLGAFTGSSHVNYGICNECMDLAIFEERAVEIAKREICLIDDGAANRAHNEQVINPEV